MTTTLSGYAAIEYARRARLLLSKYADPTEGARDGLTPDEAERVALEGDQGLIYLSVIGPHTIELACDQHEGEEFCAWLRERGHAVTIGRSTGSYVYGVETGPDDNAREILGRLWGEYCRA